jgi:hypothetical protein
MRRGRWRTLLHEPATTGVHCPRRGAFEAVLSDEDGGQDPDRWCSHAARGQVCWHLASQWAWNLRPELGHQLKPQPVRATEFAAALPPTPPHAAPASDSAPPEVGAGWKAGRFAGQDVALQPAGTLRCPADQQLTPREHRREADGSLRVVSGASIRCCRPCPLRAPCQWNGSSTATPCQVSGAIASARCWPCTAALAGLESSSASTYALPLTTDAILSRAQRAHSRLVGQAACSQCAEHGTWSRRHQTVWDSGGLCHLSRFANGLMVQRLRRFFSRQRPHSTLVRCFL